MQSPGDEEIKLTDTSFLAPKYVDHIDKALRRFTTRYQEDDFMPFQFVRQSEGIYRFGVKHFKIKLDKCNELKVKQGSKYTDIREFLSAQTDHSQTLFSSRARSS